MSYLLKFRASKMYRNILKKKGKLFVTSKEQTPANLKERAEAMIRYVELGGDPDTLTRMMTGSLLVESNRQLADAVLAMLVDADLDRFIVEVEGKEGSILVYVKPAMAKKIGAIRGMISEIGEAEIVQKPEDDPTLGLFVIQVKQRNDSDDLVASMSRFEPKDDKFESDVEPQADTKDKRGRRVLQDDSDSFIPAKKKAKRKNENLLEDDFGLNDVVYFLVNDRVVKGNVIDITQYGTPYEDYHVRMLDGSMFVLSRNSVYASPKALVARENKYRSSDRKISIDVC